GGPVVGDLDGEGVPGGPGVGRGVLERLVHGERHRAVDVHRGGVGGVGGLAGRGGRGRVGHRGRGHRGGHGVGHGDGLGGPVGQIEGAVEVLPRARRAVLAGPVVGEGAHVQPVVPAFPYAALYRAGGPVVGDLDGEG